MVKLSQSPVNEPEFSFFVINHDIVWFDVSVHDTARVTKVQSLQKLKYVVANIKIGQFGV
jgi:hypothetical protein